MNENNAAQAAQKDWDAATSVANLAPATGHVVLNAATVLNIAALLSKLRAPVADERDRNATISQIVGLCNRIPGATTWNAAQFMYDEMHRRAALASAPVAGEAIGYVDSLYLACRQRGLPCFGTIHHTPTSDATAPVYAEPQASAEDVRELPDAEMRTLIGNYFADDWAKEAAAGLLHDYARALKQTQADKGGAVDKSPNLQGSSVDRSTDLQGRGDDVVLPPLPSPPVHRGHALFAGSQMQTYARAAVLADRQERAGDARSALTWYAEQVAGCRKLGPDGDAARNALDTDGGQRARAALSAPQAEQGERG